MLQKTMVVVEGVARNLDPKLDIWAASEPVVRSWIERNLGPIGRVEEGGRGLLTLAKVISDLPEIALRAERLMTKLENVSDRALLLEHDTITGIGRHPARTLRLIAWGLWVIVVLLVFGVTFGL